MNSNNPLSQVSVVILTLNAEKNIGKLLKKLQKQTVHPYEIIIADSESNDRTVEICKQMGAKLLPIKRSEFNHGGTRDYALRTTKGNYVLFLTHDAMPNDERLIERLLNKIQSHSQLAAVYARQLPNQTATHTERLIREFNYPPQSHIRSISDLSEHGIKTFFMSDVCALYRKNIYLDIGGFEKDIKTNEDMFFAANAIQRGYLIGYEAEAKVVHSHNFSLEEQYKRNYIQGYEIERHQKLLANVSQNSEGMRLVKYVSKALLTKGHFLSWVHFGFDCCARYAGSYIGKKKAQREKQEV